MCALLGASLALPAGVSAIAKWRFSGGLRVGYCRNRLGAGRWGVRHGRSSRT